LTGPSFGVGKFWHGGRCQRAAVFKRADIRARAEESVGFCEIELIGQRINRILYLLAHLEYIPYERAGKVIANGCKPLVDLNAYSAVGIGREPRRKLHRGFGTGRRSTLQ